MTTLRQEARKSLQWCLDQTDLFTAPMLYAHLGMSQPAANAHLAKFYRMDLLDRYGKANRYSYAIKDREKAQRLASEQPLPKNGYVRVAQRTRRTFAGVNSVFGLGMLPNLNPSRARAFVTD